MEPVTATAILPSMWRVELLHPLTVHFPIGLLVTAAALRLMAAVVPARFADVARARHLDASGRLLTVLGAIASWPAYYTGTLAEEEVNSVLCDPELTHLHGDIALYVALLFSVVAAVDLIGFAGPYMRFFKPGWSRFFAGRAVAFALALVALVGAVLISYAGHLGATLVYQQGAAVYKTSPMCTEFTE